MLTVYLSSSLFSATVYLISLPFLYLSNPAHVYVQVFPSFKVIVLIASGIVIVSSFPSEFVIVASNVMFTESGLIPSWLFPSIHSLFTVTLVFSISCVFVIVPTYPFVVVPNDVGVLVVYPSTASSDTV